jgi:hypothetical protein
LKDANVTLENEDIYNLMEMCIFDTLVLHGQISPFCALFEDEEWRYYEYSADVDKYYNTGYVSFLSLLFWYSPHSIARYGNPLRLGRIQGVCYASELLTRLISSSPSFNESILPFPQTNQNSSLPFPLNRKVYVDFSHDNLMVGVFTAMGLFTVENDLPTRWMLEDGKWVVSRLTPFSARMVVEKLDCVASSEFGGEPKDDTEEFVRVLVNDAVQPLDFCRDRGNERNQNQSNSRSLLLSVGDGQLLNGYHKGRSTLEDRRGLCSLKSFVESQVYVRNGGDGDWERCFDD